MKTGYLVSPTGRRIVGTAEILYGTAYFKDSPAKLLADGSFEFPEFRGETEVFYDSATTEVDAEGNCLYVDDRGSQWPKSKLTFQPDEEDEGDE